MEISLCKESNLFFTTSSIIMINSESLKSSSSVEKTQCPTCTALSGDSLTGSIDFCLAVGSLFFTIFPSCSLSLLDFCQEMYHCSVEEGYKQTAGGRHKLTSIQLPGKIFWHISSLISDLNDLISDVYSGQHTKQLLRPPTAAENRFSFIALTSSI